MSTVPRILPDAKDREVKDAVFDLWALAYVISIVHINQVVLRKGLGLIHICSLCQEQQSILIVVESLNGNFFPSKYGQKDKKKMRLGEKKKSKLLPKQGTSISWLTSMHRILFQEFVPLCSPYPSPIRQEGI